MGELDCVAGARISCERFGWRVPGDCGDGGCRGKQFSFSWRRSGAAILCNAVDDPPNCDFYFGAVVKRGSLQVAISSAGESPALVQRLRREIDAGLDEAIGEWLRVVGELRREIFAMYPATDARKQSLHRLARVEVCDAHDCPARLARRAAGPRPSSAWSDCNCL